MDSLLTLRRPRGSKNLTEGRKAAILTPGKVNKFTYLQIASKLGGVNSSERRILTGTRSTSAKCSKTYLIGLRRATWWYTAYAFDYAQLSLESIERIRSSDSGKKRRLFRLDYVYEESNLLKVKVPRNCPSMEVTQHPGKDITAADSCRAVDDLRRGLVIVLAVISRAGSCVVSRRSTLCNTTTLYCVLKTYRCL
jgi:hypothetical protein